MAKLAESDNGNKINMIGVGTTIEGNINSSENIRFDGNLIGNLNTKGKVFIGQSGKINGEIRCKNCEVEGVLEGKLVDEKGNEIKKGMYWFVPTGVEHGDPSIDHAPEGCVAFIYFNGLPR